MYTSITAAQDALTRALARQRPPFVKDDVIAICQRLFGSSTQWDGLDTPDCIAFRLIVTSLVAGEPALGNLLVDFNGAVFIEGQRPDAEHTPIFAAQYDAVMDALHTYAEAREAYNNAHPPLNGNQMGAILAKALLITVRKGQAAGDAFMAKIAAARPAFVAPSRVVH